MHSTQRPLHLCAHRAVLRRAVRRRFPGALIPDPGARRDSAADSDRQVPASDKGAPAWTVSEARLNPANCSA